MPQPLQIDIFSLTGFNTLLLILSLAVTVGILRGAARDNVRTAVERLDDVALRGNRKLVPMLHRFQYRGLDDRSSCKVLIKQYTQVEAGSVPEGFLEHLDPDIDTEREERFTELLTNQIALEYANRYDTEYMSYVENTEYSPDGLVVEIETKNPVYVKRIVDGVMSGVRQYATDQPLVENEGERAVETETD